MALALFRSGIRVLLIVIAARTCISAQRSASAAAVLVATSQIEAPEVARAQCKNAANCFDAGAYVIRVVDIIEGDVPGYRLARLVLRFENLTDNTLVLGYRSGSSFMVDNFKNRYSCCRTDSTREDTSAIGIGVDRDDKVSPQFMLRPRATDMVSFDLWRHRPPDQQASYYHFDIMIDEIDPSSLKTILRHQLCFSEACRPERPGPIKRNELKPG